MKYSVVQTMFGNSITHLRHSKYSFCTIETRYALNPPPYGYGGLVKIIKQFPSLKGIDVYNPEFRKLAETIPDPIPVTCIEQGILYDWINDKWVKRIGTYTDSIGQLIAQE